MHKELAEGDVQFSSAPWRLVTHHPALLARSAQRPVWQSPPPSSSPLSLLPATITACVPSTVLYMWAKAHSWLWPPTLLQAI